MNQIPFSVYDFFGYLAAGTLLLAAAVAAFAGYEPFQHTPNLLVGVLLVIASYIAGHLVANVAGDILERRIVREWLGTPVALLLELKEPSGSMRKILPGYSWSLPSGVQSRIRANAAKRGVDVEPPGDALFFHCHAVMKDDAAVQARLDTFLNLYGFCRNCSLALAFGGIALGIGLLLGDVETGPDVGPGWWILAAAVGAIGLFFRYLKFYRQYALELLTSYAETGRP